MLRRADKPTNDCTSQSPFLLSFFSPFLSVCGSLFWLARVCVSLSLGCSSLSSLLSACDPSSSSPASRTFLRSNFDFAFCVCGEEFFVLRLYVFFLSLSHLTYSFGLFSLSRTPTYTSALSSPCQPTRFFPVLLAFFSPVPFAFLCLLLMENRTK